MGSEWAKEAQRQAEALTRELGHGDDVLVVYQKREARFALKKGSETTYYSAHDYEGHKGMDWQQLRQDMLARVKAGNQEKVI
jgi:hypothetical protein